MPKLLVLFHAHDAGVIALAEAAVEGARSVRFSEVDLRRLETPGAAAGTTAPDGAGRMHRALDRVDDIAAYDGIILALPATPDAAATTVDTLAGLGGSLANKVGSVLTAAEGEGRGHVLWSALAPMADRGMILLPPPSTTTGEPAADSARRTGKRVAEVIGWVTHARSHHHHEPHQHDHHSHHQH